ncbi:hypothetical protein AMTR_s00009p00147720 [Amborella trichopoda]|uniref:Uncharacterized protein n=1 Tax=Amborella trichopoda TaxID=13333 RepID=W1NGH6_AMBTC|nr:hypothetical protein AMTR_s00009p00147720 [Amborella trichopoda]
MQDASRRLKVHDPALMESYDESYLDGLAELPLNFVKLNFRNHFNVKGNPQLHVMSYLAIHTLRDKPTALNAIFAHSLVGNVVTWNNNFVRDLPESTCSEIFRKFAMHHLANKLSPISLGELATIKAGTRCSVHGLC